jgi:hypothetical protein
MLLEGQDRVWEVAMVENENGCLVPAGVRDVNYPDAELTERPPLEQLREAMHLAVWAERNQCVFEGITSGRNPEVN